MHDSFWRAFRQSWCRHGRTTYIPKTKDMPAHRVCDTCGWREAIVATRPPVAARTWDSTRDERRYERDKQRRLAIEKRRLSVIALRATPATPPARTSHERALKIVTMKQSAAG